MASANGNSKNDGAPRKISLRGATLKDIDELTADTSAPSVSSSPSIIEDKNKKRFQVGLGGVISLNILLIAVEMDWGPQGEGVEAKNRIGWILIDSIFTLIFLVELVCRMHWERALWIYSTWNWLDLLIVLTAIVDTWILSFVTKGANLQILTVLRVVRLMRLLRMLKLARALRGAYVLAMALISAAGSMSFVFLLMVYGVLLYSIFATVLIGHNDSFKGVLLGSPPNFDTVEGRFGTVYRSMFSLFELMTLEGWQQTARPLIEKQPATLLFIGSFLMLFTFGLLNMVVAVSCEKTLAQTRQLREFEEDEQRQMVKQELRNFKLTFQNSDQDGDDNLTLEEFESALAQRDLRCVLEQLNIPIDDAKQLFRVLDWKNLGGVELKDFVEGIVKIQAEFPSAMDVVSTHANVRRIDQRQEQLVEKIGKIETCMDTKDRRQEQLIEIIEKLETRMDSQNAMIREVLDLVKDTAPSDGIRIVDA